MEFISFTNILFAKPSFLSGAARVLDLGGVYDSYNYMPNPAMADYLAIASDWKTVGMDMKSAIQKYKMNVSQK